MNGRFAPQAWARPWRELRRATRPQPPSNWLRQPRALGRRDLSRRDAWFHRRMQRRHDPIRWVRDGPYAGAIAT